MCQPVTCQKCGRTTWSGCGQHVDSVMSRVPKSQRCECAEQPSSGGFFAKLFGR